MSIRAVLSCNGMEGVLPCRQATPVGEVLNGNEARYVARTVHGWSAELVEGQVADFCQACTKRRQK